MAYIDGWIVAVPATKKAEYLAFVKSWSPIFKDYGTLKTVENWGVDVPDGETTSFPLAVKRKPDEVVVFGWMVWPSKEVRDEGWEKAMSDPRMADDHSMPFDGKRMVFGAFETIFDE